MSYNEDGSIYPYDGKNFVGVIINDVVKIDGVKLEKPTVQVLNRGWIILPSSLFINKNICQSIRNMNIIVRN